MNAVVRRCVCFVCALLEYGPRTERSCMQSRLELSPSWGRGYALLPCSYIMNEEGRAAICCCNTATRCCTYIGTCKREGVLAVGYTTLTAVEMHL